MMRQRKSASAPSAGEDGSVEGKLQQWAAMVTWPDPRHHDTYVERVRDYMQQWYDCVDGVLVDGTNHMRRAIMKAFEGIPEPRFRKMLHHALHKGFLPGEKVGTVHEWSDGRSCRPDE